jgi:hypothetical protein
MNECILFLMAKYGFQMNVSFMLTVPVQGDTDQRQVLAQSANWLKRTDRLLCRESETSVKNTNTFIFG